VIPVLCRLHTIFSKEKGRGYPAFDLVVNLTA
jgi:hypothetical protein